MFLNYLKIIVRNIRRQKFYFFINIFGLSIGMATTILILFYVLDELSYDRFHTDADRIYRVGIVGKLAGQEFNGCTSPAPMAGALAEEIPDIDEAIRLNVWTKVITRFEDKSFIEPTLLLADSNFFNFFSFQLLEGNPDEVLKGPNKLVITESTAMKYFGYTKGQSESPIGKTMVIGNGDRTCMVVGIVQDPPTNSHFHFQMIMSMDSWGQSRDTYWTSNSFYTYYKVNKNATLPLTEKFEGLVQKFVGPEIEQFLGIDLAEFRKRGGNYQYKTERMTDIHLKSTFDEQIEPGGNIDYLYIFGSIAIFIILIACINFMNLSTARAANRAKEVGIRKTIGAMRGKLIGQFFAESICYALISLVLAALLVGLVLPSFNLLAGKTVAWQTMLEPQYIFVFVGLTVLVGVGAGSYPAMYLTSFQPVDVLKGKIRAGFKSSGIRNILVVLQFSISIGLIISTLLVFEQLDYMQSKNLGFKKENVLVLDNMPLLGTNQKVFKDWLLQHDGVVTASYSNMMPPHINNNSVFRPLGENAEENIFFFYFTDLDHLEAMGMEMSAGRYFSEDHASDSSAVILNEAAMKQLGWESYEDQQLLSYFDSEEGTPLHVIGVVKDFNFESLKNNVRPLLLLYRPVSGMMSIRVNSENIRSTIQLVEEKWKELSNNAPFEYVFLDHDFDALFRAEQRMGSIFMVFTIMAIAIACLGLLGLASFTTEQRAKEISIRKAMGASIGQVVALLSSSFTKLVLIAFLITTPITYYGMNQWLSGFAYRINIGIITLLMGGIAALLVTWITISFQSVRAARANPVDSLRSE